MRVNVVGAGLAGCEAAWKVTSNGINVRLFEMKPRKFSKAHKSENFAELVCSNSFKSNEVGTAAGLLKEEMRILDSLLLSCAEECKVPAGGALAVDRDKFSQMVTARIKSNKLIEVVNEEFIKIPKDEVTIVATGPLTSDRLGEEIKNLTGDFLSFYDAAAPIVTKESIDMSEAFFASRYNKGQDNAYINCPLSKEQYEEFYKALISAERAPVHDFDENAHQVYEGCMPVEVMAKRGERTLLFGPMKPVGLINPQTGRMPYAAVQLRVENEEGTLYNLVGFQTNLKFQEQRRVLTMIPALKNAEFVRFGVMHRNTFLDSPKLLNRDFSLRQNHNIFFAGQITGVEGYMESAASGILAGINAARHLKKEQSFILPSETMMGALSEYVSSSVSKNFQPMGANFGILNGLKSNIKAKKDRHMALAERSLQILNNLIPC